MLVGNFCVNQADALDIVPGAVWTIIMASGPAVAMAVGLIIAVIQALTQVQGVTEGSNALSAMPACRPCTIQARTDARRWISFAA